MNTCTPAAYGMLASFLVVCCIVVVQAWRVLRALRSDAKCAMRTADAARIERDTRHLRAGAAAIAAPDPALTDHRATAIDRAARSAARADFRLGRKSGNPFKRHSRDFAWWAISYCDEWSEQQDRNGSIDTGEEAAQPPATQPPGLRVVR